MAGARRVCKGAGARHCANGFETLFTALVNRAFRAGVRQARTDREKPMQVNAAPMQLQTFALKASQQQRAVEARAVMAALDSAKQIAASAAQSGRAVDIKA
jgi:hypothetical protein